MMKEYVLSIHLGDVKFYVYDFGFELILFFFWLIRLYFWVLMALHSLFELKKNNNN